MKNLLFRLDLRTNLVDDADQAHICLYKVVLAFRVERLALSRNAVRGISRTADEVGSRFAGVFCEFLESYLTDSACGADEDCDDAPAKGGRDGSIGRGD